MPEPKMFLVVVAHTNSRPLDDRIPEDHAFFTMLTTHVEGTKDHRDLEVNEGGCKRQAATADGRYVENHKTRWIQYNVMRVQ